MTETATAPVPAQGLLARFIGIITSPTATFRSVIAHPRVAGMLFLVAFIMAIAAAAPQFTEKGRQAAIDMNIQATERMFNRQLTAEEMQGVEQRASLGAYGSAIAALVFIPLVTVVMAGLYFVFFNAIMGGTATFKQVLAVTAHSGVITAVGAAIGAPIQLMQGTMSMAGPFNLGMLVTFLAEDNFLARLLGGLSVFSIWGCFVAGIGLAVLYRRSAIKIGIALTVITVAFTAAMVAVFGSFMSR